jgi:hypothetical protein
MNKGFRQIQPNELSTFFINSGNSASNQTITGEVVINVCLSDDGCTNSPLREFSKWFVDQRSQGIYLKKCLFYQETNRNICETREN